MKLLEFIVEKGANINIIDDKRRIYKLISIIILLFC
jgi:hypothetical protein